MVVSWRFIRPTGTRNGLHVFVRRAGHFFMTQANEDADLFVGHVQNDLNRFPGLVEIG